MLKLQEKHIKARLSAARKSINRERKRAENYNKWHNKFIFLNCNQPSGNFKPQQFPSAVLIKLLLYILLEKYIYILAVEVASPGNQHCANCIGKLIPNDKMSGTFSLPGK